MTFWPKQSPLGNEALMKHLLYTILAAVVLVASAPLKPLAHESPVDHVDRGIRIWVKGENIYLRYQLQLSERAAMMQLTQIDRNGDAVIADSERDEYFASFADALSKQLHLKLGNRVMELKRDGKIELLPEFRQVFTFSARCGPLESGRLPGVFSDEYSRSYPGAYRWDAPQIDLNAGPRVVVKDAPKAITVEHSGFLQINFEIVVP
jgi:hypothetical protein